MRVFFWCIAGAALTMMLGCGGGGSGSSPAPQVTLPGAGAAVAFNQKITFVINVPSATAATSAKNRRAAATSTTPYVSTQTGSVLLILAEINGASPQQAPPGIAPINVPASCQGSAAGCTIPVKNIPAALGLDRYFVQTFAGANATGALISTGFVDVSVPASSNPAIGGSAAALSIGGFVNTIVLAPASINFVTGTPGDQSVLVQALDAAGATIVGAAQFVTPITVSVVDSQNFTLNGAPSVTVVGPLAKPLDLHYGGGNTFGTGVEATSQNGTGTAVSATAIAVNILAPGSSPTPTTPLTPQPSAVPTSLPSTSPRPSPTPVTNALSLYVADGQSDTISEYRFGTQIASGIIPNPAATPSRVLQFNPLLLPAPILNDGTACAPALQSVSLTGNGTGAVAVSPTGVIYLFPNCFDYTADTNYVFGYAPNAVGSPPPTYVDPIPLGFTGVGSPVALFSDNSHNMIFAADYGQSDFVTGFPAATNGPPSVDVGLFCFSEFREYGNCANGSGAFGNNPAGVAFDGNGFAYVPGYWNDQPKTGDAVSLSQPAAMLAVPITKSGNVGFPYAALTGLNSAIGGTYSEPVASVVDGTTLYVLTGTTTLYTADPNNPVFYFPGVSSCPPPSPNAPINSLVPLDGNGEPNGVTQCTDGQQHVYLVAYPLGPLLGSGPNANVDQPPYFIIGGDVVGGFGCLDNTNGSNGGQYLAVSAGYVYVINLSPTCTTDGNPNVSPEIDVYNTNGVTGVHTDIAPIFKLPLPTGLPLAVSLGPTGTATGGQALLHVRRAAYRLQQHRAAESRYPRRHAQARTFLRR